MSVPSVVSQHLSILLSNLTVDHENWLQCHECGLIVPIYEIEKEATIEDVLETIDNPFDNRVSLLGIDTRAMSKKKRRQRERQRELDVVNDPDLKRELASGQTILLSYTEL
ncbi:MAG: hypothetical protein EHM25_05875 [Nitrosopumilales archaeon]|nr:MAG: hypothetical protein EHM25_05875 [Nitrosopumilales archaeon]